MNSDQNSFNNDFNFSQISKDCKQAINSIIDQMPFFIKIIVFLTLTFFILNLFTPFFSFYLADIPYFTIFHFQLWRLFTTAFITTGLLSIVFSLLFWYRDAAKKEQEMGTIKYMLYFFMMTFFIQTIYCLLMMVLSIIIQNTFMLKLKITINGIRNEGLWPILMCDLTLLCLNNPEENMRFFLFPCIIKAKYYPLVLFGIFTVLSGFNIDFEIFCGIGFGFLYHYFLQYKIQISNTFVLKVENSMFFQWMLNKKGFISINNTSSTEIPVNLETTTTTDSNSSETFSAFKGKGVTLGSSDENISRETVDYAHLSSKVNDESISTETALEMNNTESSV